jgi:hypothetical protein
MSKGRDNDSWAGEQGRAYDQAVSEERRKEKVRLELLRELYYRQHTIMDIRFFPKEAREFANRVKEVI